MELYQKTAHELSEMLIKKEIRATEIVTSVFSRIQAVEPSVHSFVTIAEEQAFNTAKTVDEKRARGENIGPMAGIPIAVKDNMSTEGIRTTCSSKILDNYIPPYDATVVEHIKNDGLILVGKTNMDEFAMGSSTENSGLFVTKNPWDLDSVPGGSSGGSAAAVCADETIVALGSDTGGSIRQPAGYCGVVGMKPTYGRVSRYGLVAFASSLDQIGPLTKDVTDTALLLQTIAKYDRKDSTSVDYPVPDYLLEMKKGVKGLRVGLAKEYMAEGISEPVKAAVENCAKVLQSLGAEIVNVSLPTSEYALATYYIISGCEASSNLARYDGIRYGYRTKTAVSDSVELYMKTRQEGFGPEVKRRIMTGTYALSSGYYDAYYLKAQKVRTIIREDFNKAFELCDLILTPTTPAVAFKIGSKTKDPVEMYLGDICTVTCNLAGLPGISIPGGFDRGMPIGLQMLGPAFKEENLLRAAYGFEQATEFHKAKPQLG